MLALAYSRSFVLFISAICFLSIAKANNGPIKYLKTEDGIIVFPQKGRPGDPRLVRLQVISDNIIRVTASPVDTLSTQKSLIMALDHPLNTKWGLKEEADKLTLKTLDLTAIVDIETGVVLFLDSLGNKIVGEKQNGGKGFEPTVFDGETSYHIQQTFETFYNDAIYGLGQHQDGIYNYKGQQVNLFQNNTEVAIPFLVSNKNYGILWDNGSITKVGDARNFKPLSSLRLFSKYGDQGWLTASYYNENNRSGKADFEKAESKIDYEYLNDSKLFLPKEFNITTGSVIWEGAFAADASGNYKFRFTYAGYVKVWVDGKLMVDRWREAWNPGTALIDLNIVKDQKYPIKIEWVPDGSESYLSSKWQSPVMGADQADFSFLSEAGKQLDYYLIHGKNIDSIISGYRLLTGKAPIAPKWAMGFWQSRERYKTEEELLNTVAEFRKRKIPLDNIVQDWSYWKQDDWGSQDFDPTRYPSPDSMINLLHEKYHTQFMISVWPKFYEGIPAYNFFDEKGWLYKRNIANRQRDWIGNGYVSTFYDAFNTDAQKGFWNLLNKKLYQKGVDAWWMDASEPDILSNVSPNTRKELMEIPGSGIAAETLNAYPLENAKGIYEGQRLTNPDKRVFILTRSAFAGSQRYAAAVWSGDIAARWEDMRAQSTAGINFSMSGLPYWTMDIGGFAVEQRYEHPNAKDLEEWREQMTRWYQFGAFCPLFRVHGQYPYREIFNTAPEDHPAYKSMLYYDKLRYRLMPYIYSLAGMVYQKDYTLMRGLVMDFPDDASVNTISDQYMFGPSILVNPVFTYQAKSRDLYLPAGQGWYDFYSGKYFEGGQKINADAPYERIPLFVKEGSIIPFGPDLQYVSEKKANPISLFIYTGKDACFDLYEDEGINYNYEKGFCTDINICYNESAKTLKIEKRKGSFPGMLKDRAFKIFLVKKEKEGMAAVEDKPFAIIKYNGKEKTINLK
ncbi:MAG: DUF5110 domain-containing protein [Bacteroidetes bacterium]|nr:DUF5110 domain-containing protein [Bacteroidota bacterium]